MGELQYGSENKRDVVSEQLSDKFQLQVKWWEGD